MQIKYSLVGKVGGVTSEGEKGGETGMGECDGGMEFPQVAG